MWFNESVFYQIYTLNFCGAPHDNDGIVEHRILRLNDFMDYFEDLGINAIYFNPVFSSDHHGYDTRDYCKIDERLGTNEDFIEICKNLHDRGMRVVLDGVFNHVGRGFFAFQDVLNNRENSQYKNWFRIDFNGNSPYDDGFYYEGWEGHNELVKLNLDNPDVRQHQFDAIKQWTDLYGIDGLRLDVAYCLSDFYLKELRRFTSTLKEDFVLMGETLHGDYNMYMNDEKCHSVTNYECYKGLYSSFNCANMHEISYSLNRQFGYENWCIYRGKHLLSFVDNHDVSRIATILEDKQQLPVIYGLLFGMPGVPSIYYGSEWGIEGKKQGRDEEIRPRLEKPEWNELSDAIAAYAKAHHTHPALYNGGYANLLVRDKQLIFERSCDEERVIVAINADSNTFHADFNARSGLGTDLVTGETVDFGGGMDLPPYSVAYWKTEVI